MVAQAFNAPSVLTAVNGSAVKLATSDFTQLVITPYTEDNSTAQIASGCSSQWMATHCMDLPIILVMHCLDLLIPRPA
jgi:hypothetical protein